MSKKAKKIEAKSPKTLKSDKAKRETQALMVDLIKKGWSRAAVARELKESEHRAWLWFHGKAAATAEELSGLKSLAGKAPPSRPTGPKGGKKAPRAAANIDVASGAKTISITEATQALMAMMNALQRIGPRRAAALSQRKVAKQA